MNHSVRTTLLVATALASCIALAQPEPAETGLSALPAPAPATPVAPAPAVPTSPVAAILAAKPPVTPYADPLTLESAMNQALAANYDVKLQRLTSTSAADNEQIALSNFDTTLAVSASTGAYVDASGTTTNPRTDSRDSRLSASQRLSATGATVTASGSLARSERSPVTSLLNPAYNSDVGLAIRQPLLKGAGATINQSAIERARLGTERARADFAAQVFTLVRDVEVAYANLALAREQVGIRSFSLEVRKKLLEENTARRDTGVATDLEVLQAEVGVATAARDLVLARQSAQDREDELQRLLGRDSFENPIGPVALVQSTPPPVDVAASLQRARANTPEFASAVASIRQQEIDVRTAKNAGLPQLDFGVQGGLNDTSARANESTSNLWNGDGYSWQMDLSLSMPWGFRAERARLRQARSSLDREELRRSQIEQQILVSVRVSVRAVETGIENLRLSALTATLAAREYEVEKARYDSGLSTFRRVQETQDALDQARLAELQAKVNLRTAQANLDRLEGTAPARYRLSLLP
ncbi:MAG: TolC family protein [Verrucomicrobia bacterium]|nr:TolC family protein [Verrucomicrobiota bacterium]